MATYTYIKTDGTTGTTTDKTNAPGIDPHSGFQEKVSTALPSSPVGVLSSTAGTNVVNTTIKPAIDAGKTAQAGAAQTTLNNQTASDTRAQTDAENAIPSDIQDPLQARADANAKAQRDQLAQEQQMYSQLTLANTEAVGSQIRQLQGEWADIANQQKATNENATANLTTAGLRAGTARYAPQINEGMIAAQKSYGIQKLKEIDTKYNEAITSANNGLASKNLEIAMASAKASQDFLQQAAKEINDQIVNAQKIASDAAKAKADMQKDIATNVSTKLVGAPASVLDAVSKATSIAEAVRLAGPYLANASGVVGEWQAVNATRTAQGKPLIDIETYMNEDANRKRPIIHVGVGGMSSQQATLATKLSDDYEQRSKDFYTLRNGYNQVVSSSKDPTGAGDISLLYGYMKMLDPNSVVRETEFATAQNAGSIPENIRAKYNAAVNGKKLSDAQRNDFINQASKVYNASKKQQDVTVKEFTDRANKYGVPADLIVRGTEATGTADAAAKTVDQANQSIINLGKQRPELQPAILKFSTTKLPSTGQPPSLMDIYQWAKANNYVQ